MRDVSWPAPTRATRPRCLAVDVYAHRLRQQIAAMAAAMDGLDALVFTGGIGEHQPPIRAEAAALGFLGVAIDAERNQAAPTATPTSPRRAPPCAPWSITAREDIEIARQVRALLTAALASPAAAG